MSRKEIHLAKPYFRKEMSENVKGISSFPLLAFETLG